MLTNGARGDIRYAESHLQVRPAGSIDFRAESSPSPPPTPRQPRQQQQTGLVGCVTQLPDEVKAWVRSNAGVLFRSGGGLDKTGSIPGDAGGPSALDALPLLEHGTDHAR